MAATREAERQVERQVERQGVAAAAEAERVAAHQEEALLEVLAAASAEVA